MRSLRDKSGDFVRVTFDAGEEMNERNALRAAAQEFGIPES